MAGVLVLVEHDDPETAALRLPDLGRGTSDELGGLGHLLAEGHAGCVSLTAGSR
jgi:hypothetical protein